MLIFVLCFLLYFLKLLAGIGFIDKSGVFYVLVVGWELPPKFSRAFCLGGGEFPPIFYIFIPR